MSDHVPVSRPNPLLERLFGGNMLEGTFKAVIWVAILSALLAWTTLRCDAAAPGSPGGGSC